MSRLSCWYAICGGLLFLAGVLLHPHEHVEDGTLEEQFHAMFSDPKWYPAHLLLLAGLVLMTAAIVHLARHTPAALPRRTTRFVALAAVIGCVAMVLHLFAALDEDNIVAGDSTPLLYAHATVEVVTVPLLGIAFAMLAYVGGRSRVLGNPYVAVVGVVGGLSYALAGVTAPFISTFTPLFDAVGLVGVWTVLVGAQGLVRSRDERVMHEVAR